MPTSFLKAKIVKARTYEDNWAVLQCSLGVKTYKVAGTLLLDAEALIGVVCEFEGGWETHPKYGDTFKFVNLKVEGSEMFFFLERVVRIGTVAAHSIVESYGDDELTAIMEDPARHKELLQVRGIGAKRMAKVVNSWQQYRHIKLLSDYLTPYGISANVVLRVFTKYENQAIRIISENPFNLTAVPGIGFRKADQIALQLGLDPRSPQRLFAAVNFVMDQLADSNGNTLVKPRSVVLATIKELLPADDAADAVVISQEEIEGVIQEMLDSGALVSIGDGISLEKHFNTEKRILEILNWRATLPPTRILSMIAVEEFIVGMEAKMDITFSEEQSEALRMVATGYRTIAVTGHAGTGKSTLSKAIVNLLLSKYEADDVLCCALSGIASDRIRKTSGFRASTIHTALGSKGGSGFEHNRSNPMGYKVVVVDECSMINALLFRQLIDAVDRDSVLIFMGDPGQLPPIGGGDPFRDIINSGIIPVERLTRIFRQSEDSVLALFANEIRCGRVPEDFARAGGFPDFQFEERNLPRGYFQMALADKEKARAVNTREIQEYVAAKMRAVKPHLTDIVGDLQVISPMRKGVLGTEGLNQLAQSIFNGDHYGEKQIEVNGVVMKPGDKVVHLVNKNIKVAYGVDTGDPDGLDSDNMAWENRRVFNGSVGLIINVCREEREVMVLYPEGYVALYESLLLSSGIIELAYSLTAHKSQGSEYKYTIIPISSSHTIMLSANWLYTAITRAKTKVVLVGQKYCFEKACKSLANTARSTVLSFLLDDEMAQREENQSFRKVG